MAERGNQGKYERKAAERKRERSKTKKKRVVKGRNKMFDLQLVSVDPCLYTFLCPFMTMKMPCKPYKPPYESH